MARFITHIFNEGLPKGGYRKLTYITMSDEEDSVEEYFLGTDNNPLSKNEIELMMRKKQIFHLSGIYPKLPDNKSVFVDNKGGLYFADRLDSGKERVKLDNTVKELVDKFGEITANEYFSEEDIPKICRYHELA